MKRPNPLLYLPLGGLLKVFAWAKGQRLKKETRLRLPAIVLSNHTSFYDFVYSTAAVYPKRITYLAADKLFYNPVNRVLLHLARAIPKSLFESDPAAIRAAFRILKQGGLIGIYPEGQISGIGRTLEIPFQIAKFVKKAGVRVYVCKTQGAYFTNPPWTTKTFPGKVESRLFSLLDETTLSHMTEPEIYETITSALSFDSATWARNHSGMYHMKDVANLENLLYRCPHCGFEGLKANGETLLCPNCQTGYAGFSEGLMNGVSFETRYLAQEAAVKREIEADPNWELSGDVLLQSYRDNRLVDVGKGTLSLSRLQYRYRGTIDGEAVDKRFNPGIVPTLPADIGKNVQIYESKQIYQFAFVKDLYLSTKFVHAGELIYRMIKTAERT
jgi:1-acyl-sn-glycerol-3-phosphate acyltransferase